MSVRMIRENGVYAVSSEGMRVETEALGHALRVAYCLAGKYPIIG